ncbi:hypothetical protein [Mesorhizobium sp. M8A.F.Ca.ET.021.01.1.1]|uniref:hypothetical protein n=1 Tax=Mesorhizobium sp. M8A.F.Ca.ET.021.01.1.1 TaxID=2496757 RepID=UPI000FCA95A1|nr:hypothetical protein [Mesorhizobium sp. M8A.F.Ca.ET.021.01.1.1]RUW57118.1 hypothetical protein EOA36_00615 [Mesorhizobium sp. M8A.F.Ca.ET.021.01.1.1]
MIELIEGRAKVYRVGHMADSQGLWYDAEGSATGLIHTLDGAQAAALPMGPHPYFRAFQSRWISVTDSMANLCNWFSVKDCLQLINRDYSLLEIDTDRHARFHFPDRGYSHEVYRMADVIRIRTLDFSEWLRERVRSEPNQGYGKATAA